MFIKLMKAVYFKPTVLLMAIAMLTSSVARYNQDRLPIFR